MEFAIDLTKELSIDLTVDKEKISTTTDCDKSDKIRPFRVTKEQKKCIMHFIMENPEMISHSTTPACEVLLWTNLIVHLNNLNPGKPLRCWRRYTNRLISHLKSTPDSVLNAEEKKFKRFVIKLLGNADMQSCEENYDSDCTEVVVIDDIQHADKLELEKAKFKLDIIVNELYIERLNNLILYLKGQNIRKLKKITRLRANKVYLQKRLKKFREKRKYI